jgi:hypothetical protein
MNKGRTSTIHQRPDGMTDSTTTPRPEAAAGPALPFHPTDILMSFIVALLAPMFLGVCAGNINYARMAAIETVNAYRARSHADLIAIAQIVAFGLAALGSLSLSMADDISVSMALRLRGNANALGRSAEQNRRAIRNSHACHPAPRQADSARTAPRLARDENKASLAATRKLLAETRTRSRDAEPVRVPAPIATPAPSAFPQPTEEQIQAMWAEAMTDVAGEFTASMIHLPPEEREVASRRVAVLNSCATQLLTGVPELDFGE